MRFLLFVLALTLSIPSIARTQIRYTNDEQNTIDVFRASTAAVVNVSNVRKARYGFGYFHETEVPAGAGSGFLWDDSGHIVTNFHVIEGADTLRVSFKNGKTSSAKLVGVEPRKDIAVVKVNLPKDFTGKSLSVADSSKILVGQKAIAIGSPFGLDQTVTKGIVSAVGRSIPGVGGVTIRDMIQTDASINPGNSGGPLIDSSGRLIGMNTVIFSKSGSSAGIGFAVPSNTIKRIVNQIIRYGRVRQPSLGVTIFNDSVARRLDIDGVLIMDVIDGSGAARVGLRGTKRTRYGDIELGDLIVKVDDEKIETYDDLYNALERRKIGDTVDVHVIRDGRLKKFKITLSDVGQ